MLIDCKKAGIDKEQMGVYWKGGYVMPISDVAKMLDVSKQWINDNMVTQIDCIKYPASFLITKDDPGHNLRGGRPDPENNSGIYYTRDRIRFRRSDIYDWLCSNAIFTQQTYVADWLDYAGITEAQYDTDMQEIKNFDDYLKLLYPDVWMRPVLCRKRAAYPARRIEMQPHMLRLYDIMPTSRYDGSMERLYRDAIRKGAIRCQIGIAAPYSGQIRPRSKKTLLLFSKKEIEHPITRPVGDMSIKNLERFWHRENLPIRVIQS